MSSAANSTYVYVTYIKSTPEKVWEALTSDKFTKQFWFGCIQETDWKAGSKWTLRYPDGMITDTGEVLEIDPPKRLVLKWRNEFKPELKAEGFSRCTMTLEPTGGAVKLTISHQIDVPGAKFIEAVGGGWPMVLSNLKSLLETGAIAVTR
ncbi:MAG TPA: SRPBCC family protein [bacterium]